MGSPLVFVMRVILALLLAFLIGRLYFKPFSLGKVAILAAVLFGLACIFQYTKKRDRGGQNGS